MPSVFLWLISFCPNKCLLMLVWPLLFSDRSSFVKIWYSTRPSLDMPKISSTWYVVLKTLLCQISIPPDILFWRHCLKSLHLLWAWWLSVVMYSYASPFIQDIRIYLFEASGKIVPAKLSNACDLGKKVKAHLLTLTLICFHVLGSYSSSAKYHTSAFNRFFKIQLL